MTKFEVVGNHEILLQEFETLQEAKDWAKRYTATENAGGYDTVSCNIVPMVDGSEFVLERGVDY